MIYVAPESTNESQCNTVSEPVRGTHSEQQFTCHAVHNKH